MRLLFQLLTALLATGQLLAQQPITAPAKKPSLTTTTQQLTAITIKGNKPLITTADDKISYNVENDVSLTGLSAAEALAKVPMITVDGNGGIQLKGQNTYQILLNGKQTSMFANQPGEVLKAFPASTIARIEVITSPSAKYEGEGITGIINIITKKKVTGYNGSSACNYNTIGQINPNTSFNLKYGKIGVTSFAYLAKNIGFDTHGSQQYKAQPPAASFASRTATDTAHATGYMWGANVELSCDLDSLQSISIYGRLAASGKTNDLQSKFTTTGTQGQLLQYSTFHTGDRADAPAGEWGADYTRRFQQKDRQLSLGINRQFNRQSGNTFSEQYNTVSPDRFLLNDFRTKNMQTSVQVDYTHPLTPMDKLELGARFIQRQVEATYTGRSRSDKTMPYNVDPANNDALDYTQRVTGAYSVWTHKWPHGFTSSLSARLEHTTVNGDFANSHTTATQNYWSLLPAASLSRSGKEGQRLTLAYNRRLVRPGVAFLNPYTDNRDPLYITSGNPTLTPEFADNIEAAFNASNNNVAWNIAINTSFLDHGIQRVLRLDEHNGVSYQTYENAGTSKTVGFSGFVSVKPFPKCDASLNLNLNYSSIRNNSDAQQRNEGWFGGINTSLSYTPTDKWMCFSNIAYTRPPVQLQGQNGDYLFYNLGGGYWLLKRKLLFTLAGLNIFNKYWQMKNTFQAPGSSQQIILNRPMQAVSVSLRYNFGRLKENTSRKKGVQIDDTKTEIQ
ncbi:TonB-dependent receptor [Chitinophaga pendula]|uniref:outer membrane beta-barrel family protein n=1 Tax=Chitinophaga TaxID=79328 RepID=UPI000BB02AF7|nr:MULTISPECIES: outer membrane beta-barrel family protein [Chitinophaga]ASZ12623.1 hypothetical protein CK934_17500 [Chitinophaga sp. MD30]UCJ09769.1 TonB-dependent receptor [Chitinophaga pendula]